jgi:hypothetical protein
MQFAGHNKLGYGIHHGQYADTAKRDCHSDKDGIHVGTITGWLQSR